MKQDQKLTPKYWVLHDKTSDDIFPASMRKNRHTVYLWACCNVDEDWEYTNQYEIILIEIKKVEVE